ncbi:hypothetical protein EAF04_004074 [Stromatinia cepivora]|nr:hypothetical protein EAF04_004074 [Stromatinia cepivora]
MYFHIVDLTDYYLGWETLQKTRINSLSDREVLEELRDIMAGRGYSWYGIARGLHRRYRKGLVSLEHFDPGNVLYKWNVLYNEKVSWERRKCPSFLSFRFNCTYLFNLKMIPIATGPGQKGKRIMEENLDDIFLSTSDAYLTIGDLCHAISIGIFECEDDK